MALPVSPCPGNFTGAQQNPDVDKLLHGKIEENLIAAYQRHISSLAA